MHTRALIAVLVLSALATPAIACRVLVKYPDHISDDTPGWEQAFRVIEIIEADDDRFVGLVKQNFGGKADVGKRVALQFIPDEEAHAICPIVLDIGKTYLIRSDSSDEPLLISRFNGFNIPNTHPKFHTYVRDLELASAR